MVNRVSLTGDEASPAFIVTFTNTALDDCSYGRVYFFKNDLGQDKFMLVYTLALKAVSSSALDMGVVIDKAINGVGGQCRATVMAADIRHI